MQTPREIHETVRTLVADVLSLEPDEVTSDSRFFADLGGESIDLLELGFRLEKQFGCRVDFNRLFAVEQVQPANRGTLGPHALVELRAKYPFLPVERLPSAPTPEDLKDLLTVSAIAGFTELALSEGDNALGVCPQ